MAQKSLEIRINSIEDAKSVVRNQVKIDQEFIRKECDSIDFVVANEVRSDFDKIVRGVFRRKTFTSYIIPKEGNILMSVPHYVQKEPVMKASDTVRVRATNLAPVAQSVPITTQPKRKGRKPEAKFEMEPA